MLIFLLNIQESFHYNNFSLSRHPSYILLTYFIYGFMSCCLSDYSKSSKKSKLVKYLIASSLQYDSSKRFLNELSVN